MRVDLSQEVLNDISSRFSTYVESMYELINSSAVKIGALTVNYRCKLFCDVAALYVSVYNEHIVEVVNDIINRWQEMDHGAAQLIRELDPNNEDALVTAANFEEKLKDTVLILRKNIEMPPVITEYPDIDPQSFLQCAELLKSCSEMISQISSEIEQYMQAQGEENVVYKRYGSFLELVSSQFGSILEQSAGCFEHFADKTENKIRKTCK